MNENNIQCPICFDDINKDFCILNCHCKTYIYHNYCINNWFKIKKMCPMCKYNFPKNKLDLGKSLSKIKTIRIPLYTTNLYRLLNGSAIISYS